MNAIENRRHVYFKDFEDIKDYINFCEVPLHKQLGQEGFQSLKEQADKH